MNHAMPSMTDSALLAFGLLAFGLLVFWFAGDTSNFSESFVPL